MSDEQDKIQDDPPQDLVGWLKSIGKIPAIAIFALVLAAIDGVTSGFTYLKKAFSFLTTIHFTSLPVWVFVSLIAVMLGLAAFLFLKIEKKGPSSITTLVAMCLIAFFTGITLLMQTTGAQPNKIVIVFDEDTPHFHPAGIEAQAKAIYLSDLEKLRQIKEVDAESIFISTLSRPTPKWNSVIESGFNPINPIFSIQEVIEEDPSKIIDLSFTNFEDEIHAYFVENPVLSNKINIFFEDGYAIADQQLRDKLRNEAPIINSTSIIFEEYVDPNFATPETTLIFLGSAKGFDSFRSSIAGLEYQVLISPNWLRPNIEMPSDTDGAKNLMRVSSILDSLVDKDLEQWNTLLYSIEESMENNTNVRNILSERIIAQRSTLTMRF